MKIKKLIKKLQEVADINPNGEVYLFRKDGYESICFSGLSVNDNNEVNLYEASGDEVV